MQGGIEHVSAFLKQKGVERYKETYMQIEIPPMLINTSYTPVELPIFAANTYYILLNNHFPNIMQIEGQGEVHITNPNVDIISPIQTLFKSQLIFKSYQTIVSSFYLEIIKIHHDG